MKEIPIVTIHTSAKTRQKPTSSLLHQNEVLIGHSNGLLLVLDNELNVKHEISAFKYSIDSILSFGNAFSILTSDGNVSVLNPDYQIEEEVPLKSIACQRVHNNKLSVSTRNMIVTYEWLNGSLEMISQRKLNDKVVKFEVLDDGAVIWSNGSSFYRHCVNDEESTLLPLNSKYSLFNQLINIVPLSHKLLISRGRDSSLIKDNKLLSSFQWETAPHSEILSSDPFLILNTGNHVHIKQSNNFKTLQRINIPSVQSISIHQNELLIASVSNISIFHFHSFESIIESMSDINTSIEFSQLLSVSQFPNKFNKLRQLNIQSGMELFKEHKYSQAFHKFIDYVAPPFQIIQQYPIELTGLSESPDTSFVGLPHEAVTSLTFFVTDQRRKITKLLSSDTHSLKYKDGLISLDFFTEKKYSIEQVLQLLDTTLFNIYIETNPGLVGSLVRVDNHLDKETVINKLTNKKMINELVDFYYKKGLHEKALSKLEEISEEQASYELLLRYIQRLNNDQLELIFKYSKNLISEDESNGVKIFIDSVNSAELNRFKVQKFLNEISKPLELRYLEFIIFELKKPDVSKVLNFRLVELYLEQLENVNFSTDSEYHSKLKHFLQVALLSFDDVIKAIDDLLRKLPGQESLLVLKTMILFRMNRHEESLKIIIYKLKDPKSCIEYIKKLHDHYYLDSKTFNKNKYESIVLKNISYLQDIQDRETILSILLNPKLTDNVSLVKVLDLLAKNSNFNIQELQEFLISNINKTTKSNKYLQLTKNFKYISSIKLQDHLLNITKYKINENETKCEVCGKYISSSSITYCIPEGYDTISPSSSTSSSVETHPVADRNSKNLFNSVDVIENQLVANRYKEIKYSIIHFGCLEEFRKTQSHNSVTKMKSIKLGEFTGIADETQI